MTKKIKYLIALNIILIAAISLSLKKNTASSTLNDIDTQFALADSSMAYRITLGSHTLAKGQDGAWTINDKYQVDERRVQSLLVLLQRISVKRPVSEQMKENVIQELNQAGVTVQTLDINGQELQSFRMIGKDEDTYASIEGSTPYLIHIPGISVKVSDWLDTEEVDWRNRQVIQTTWRTLKKLTVSYQNDTQNSFEVAFNNNFYNVPGVNQLDSAAVYDYLVRVQEFKASRFVSNRPNLADSLTALSPLCSISYQDLYTERDNSLHIYPTQQTLYGVLEKGKEVIEISPRALESIMVPKSQFEKKQ